MKEQRRVSRERFLLLPVPGQAELRELVPRGEQAVLCTLPLLYHGLIREHKMLICETRYPSVSTMGETAKINKPQNILQHLNSTVTDQRQLLMSGRQAQ